MRASLREVENAAGNDLLHKEIEVTQFVDENTPDFVAVDQDLFIQVMINLLLISVQAVGQRGFIKILCQCKPTNGIQHLVIDLESSRFQMHDKE